MGPQGPQGPSGEVVVDLDAGLLDLTAISNAHVQFDMAGPCLSAISRLGVDFEFAVVQPGQVLVDWAVYPDITIQLISTSECDTHLMNLQSWFASAVKGFAAPRDGALTILNRENQVALEVGLYDLLPVAFSRSQRTIRLRPREIQLVTYSPNSGCLALTGCFPSPPEAPWYAPLPPDVHTFDVLLDGFACYSYATAEGEEVISEGAVSVAPVYLRVSERCTRAQQWLADQQVRGYGNLIRIPTVEVIWLDQEFDPLWRVLYERPVISRVTFLSPTFLWPSGDLSLPLDLVFLPEAVIRP
jgi:hypothetical protein